MSATTEIRLAPKEFDLLWELLDHEGLVLTRDQLLERVWGYTFAGDTRTVDVHVRQLRRKLGDAAPIVTVWGIGYKAVPAPPSGGSVPCSDHCGSGCRRFRARHRARRVVATLIAVRFFQNNIRRTPLRSCGRTRSGSWSSTRRRRVSAMSPFKTSRPRSAATRSSGCRPCARGHLLAGPLPTLPTSVLPVPTDTGQRAAVVRLPGAGHVVSRRCAAGDLGQVFAGSARRRGAGVRAPQPAGSALLGARARVRDRDPRRGVLVVYLSRRIAGPLEALATAADEVSTGHYDVAVPGPHGAGTRSTGSQLASTR